MAKRKVNQTGRNSGSTDRIIIIRRSLLHSPVFSALAPVSRCLLLELQAMFNGTNNGALFLSCKDAAARLGLSDLKAMTAAFNELQQLGFITQTIAASFVIKDGGGKSKARGWNLNWVVKGHCVGPDALPPLNFQVLTDAQKRRVQRRSHALARYLGDYQNRKFAVEDSSMLDARKDRAAQVLVEVSTTTKAEIGGNLPHRRMEDSTIHVEYHGRAGWWSSIRHIIDRTELDLERLVA